MPLPTLVSRMTKGWLKAHSERPSRVVVSLQPLAAQPIISVSCMAMKEIACERLSVNESMVGHAGLG